MNPITYTLGPIDAADAAAIVASNTPAAAGTLTLVGGGSSVTLDVARKVLVTFGAEAVARTIKISGTNHYGNPIYETLDVTAGAGSTVATTQDFLTVTEVRVYAAWTAAMTVGTNGVASSPPFVVDLARNPINIAFGFDVTGTVNYTLEETYDDPNSTMNQDQQGAWPQPYPSISPGSNIPPVWWNDAAIATKAADFQGTVTAAFFAFRLTLNSGTGSVKMQAIQAGFHGA